MREYLFPEDYPDVYEMFKPDPGEKIGVHIGASHNVMFIPAISTNVVLDHCFDVYEFMSSLVLAIIGI